MVAILLIAVSILPAPDTTLRDRCERIERHSLYDLEGRLVFVQVVFWDTRCVDWRLDKGNIELARDFDRGGYKATWNEDGLVRVVRAPSYCESWTQSDVELNDRELLAKESRRGLRR